MEVSIVAASHNNREDTIEFLKSIESLNFPKKQLEVIIVDNGSGDGTAESIKKVFPKVRLTELKKNLGAPKALNIGFKKAQGKYILKCDSDVILEKNSLKILLDYLKSHPNVAIVGPKNYFKNPPKKIAPAAAKFNFWLGKTSTYKNLNKELFVDYMQGSTILFQKEILDEIGYLDENYGLWLFDDQDFCLRATRKGYRVAYQPQAVIWHSTEEIANARPKKKLEQWYKNKLRFIIKNANILQIISSFSLQFFSIPYYAFFYKDGTSRAIINGFWWNVKNINKILLARKQ